MRTFIVIFIFAMGLFPSISYSQQKTNRVEELIIWKISEELKLSVKEEKEISTLIRSLDERKQASSEKIDGIIQQLSSGSEENLSKIMTQYRDALNSYNGISIEEFNKVQKILPKNKAAKYFVVKADLTKKIRSLLASSERTREKNIEKPKQEKPAPLGDPKIIEE